MFVRGDRLTPKQRELVLSAFIYRWTVENRQREQAWAGLSHPTIPLESDDNWLKAHAFHFVKDGSRLNARKKWAEPDFMAD